jgi:hypothetical protein
MYAEQKEGGTSAGKMRSLPGVRILSFLASYFELAAITSGCTDWSLVVRVRSGVWMHWVRFLNPPQTAAKDSDCSL